MAGHRVIDEGAWQLSCLEGLWGQGAWAVRAAPLLGAPMLDIAGHHTVYIPVTPISFPGYRNLDTALTPELAGEGWVNDAMVPSSSVPPSTHNSGKAELGLTVPRAIPGNQNKCLNSCLVLLRPWLAQCKLLKKQFFFWKTPLPNTEFLKVNQKIQPSPYLSITVTMDLELFLIFPASSLRLILSHPRPHSKLSAHSTCHAVFFLTSLHPPLHQGSKLLLLLLGH